jgi:hypothetical protein
MSQVGEPGDSLSLKYEACSKGHRYERQETM